MSLGQPQKQPEEQPEEQPDGPVRKRARIHSCCHVSNRVITNKIRRSIHFLILIIDKTI